MFPRTVLLVGIALWIGGLEAGSVAAQSCEERAAAHPGGWIQGNDAGGSGSPAIARNKREVDAVLDRIAALVRSAYPEPLGSQGKLYRNYGLEAFAGGEVASYELVAQFKGYGCDKRTDPNGEITRYGETATWLYVQVNSVWAGSSNFETPQYFLSSQDHQNLYALQPRRLVRKPQPGRQALPAALTAPIEGFPGFLQEQAYDSTDYSYNRREVSQIVFVTPDGGLPYEPVTIGEFLEVNAARLEAYIAENAPNGDVGDYQKLLDRIPALRQRYATRLAERAYIASFSWSESQLAQPNPFVGEADGWMLARRSAKYLAGGEAAKPRFLTVLWRWQPQAPYSVRMQEAIRGRLDFAALRGLLAS